jgi:hypothetical protein
MGQFLQSMTFNALTPEMKMPKLMQAELWMGTNT